MKKFVVTLALATTISLAACGGGEDVKEKLGLKAPPPDEFSVVTRAPLSVPPDYTLRPPRPGAEGPNETSVREQTKQTVFGATATKKTAERTKGQNSFLSKLGTDEADPSIRRSIDTEVRELEKQDQPVAEKLLFWKDKVPPGKPLDPVEEKKRLEAEGKVKATSTDDAAATDGAKGTKIKKRNEDILKAQ